MTFRCDQATATLRRFEQPYAIYRPLLTFALIVDMIKWQQALDKTL